MATTFVKNGTNVLVTIGGNDPISVPGGAFISPHPSEADAILISEKFNPQNIHESLKIYVSEVSLPVATDRKDLIEQLSTDFFFRVGGSGFDIERITGTGATDYAAPSDLKVGGAIFALNPGDAEVSSLLIEGAATIRFAIAPEVGDFPLVIYTLK